MATDSFDELVDGRVLWASRPSISDAVDTPHGTSTSDASAPLARGVATWKLPFCVMLILVMGSSRSNACRDITRRDS